MKTNSIASLHGKLVKVSPKKGDKLKKTVGLRIRINVIFPYNMTSIRVVWLNVVTPFYNRNFYQLPPW